MVNTPRRQTLARLAGLPLVALACSPFLLPGAAAAPPTKRLAIVGFKGPYFEEERIAEFLRSLAERGFAQGGRLEVVRVDIEPAPESSPMKGLDYLVPVLRREVLPVKPDVIFTMGSIMTKGLSLVYETSRSRPAIYRFP